MNIDKSVYGNIDETIGNLNSGDVFLDSDGNLMMYLGCIEITMEGFNFNAIALKTGEITYVDYAEQITPMPHAKIVLE